MEKKKKGSPFYNLLHDDIKRVITYLKSKALLSPCCWVALRVIMILSSELQHHRTHRGSSSSNTDQCYEPKGWFNVISRYVWRNMLKHIQNYRKYCCKLKAAVEPGPKWRRIKIFCHKIKSYVLWQGLLCVCSRYSNLFSKPQHNDDISSNVCHKSSTHWQRWQKFRTRGNPLTWVCSTAQNPSWRMNECVSPRHQTDRGSGMVSWD